MTFHLAALKANLKILIDCVSTPFFKFTFALPDKTSKILLAPHFFFLPTPFLKFVFALPDKMSKILVVIYYYKLETAYRAR